MPPSSRKKCCCGGASCTHYFSSGGGGHPEDWCDLPGETLYYTRTGGIAVSGGPFALAYGSNSTWRGWYGLIPITTTANTVWNCVSAYQPGTYNALLRLTCETIDGVPQIRFERVLLAASNSSNTQISVGALSVPSTGPPVLVRTCGTGPNVLWTLSCTNIQLFDCDALNVRCVLPTLPYNNLPYSLIDGRITL